MWLSTGVFECNPGVDTFSFRTKIHGPRFVGAVDTNDPRSFGSGATTATGDPA